jgi:acyl-CoA thioester hydrolase
MTAETVLYRDAAGRLCADVRFHVRYFETDSMGVVHHAAYVVWFEEGRSAFTRALGYPYARMESEGIALAVTELAARYLRSARYDEEVIVTTTLQELRSRELVFGYEVRRAEDGERLVTGQTRLVSVDAHGQARCLPSALIERAQQAVFPVPGA